MACKGSGVRIPSAPPIKEKTPSGVFCFFCDLSIPGTRLAKTFFVKTLRSRPQFQYADPTDQLEIWGPTLTP